MKVIALISVVLGLWLEPSWAQQEPLVTVEKTVEAPNASAARTKILKEAMEEVATERIVAEIGAERFQLHRAAIRQHVLQQVARFIPVANPGPVQTVRPGEYKMKVQLRVSGSSLKQVLQRQGLLYELDGPAKIFPVWSVIDKVNALTFRWWRDEGPTGREFLVEIYRESERILYSELFDRGFYYMRTGVVDNPYRVAQGLLSDRPRTTDLMKAGDQHKASIVLRGELDISQSRRVVGAYVVQVQLSAFQNANGRTVAEVTRQFETDAGVFETQIRHFLSSHFEEIAKDLGVQIQEAWERGTFGANLLVVSLPRLKDYSHYSEVKKVLSSTSKVKSVRDRRFSPEQTAFEVDYSGTIEDLESSLKSLRSAQFPYKVETVNTSEIVLSR